MTTPTPSESTPTQTPTLKDPGEMSFPEYEAMRRGEVVAAEANSAPEGHAPTEQKPAVESETTEPEDKDEEDASEGEEEESSKPEDEEAKDKPAKKKSGYQKRVDKLNARIASERAQREALEARLAQLEQTAGASKPPIDTQSPKDGEPNPDDFGTHAEYVKAVAKWTAKEELKAQRAEQEKTKLQSEHEQFERAHIERAKAFAEKTTDYAEALEDVEDVIFSAAALYEIKASQLGPQIIYELAKNRKEAERIATLPYRDVVREIAKLEARLTAASEKPKVETKKTTQAPKPIEPVGGGKTQVSKSPEEMSFPEYEKYRRQQMRRRGA